MTRNHNVELLSRSRSRRLVSQAKRRHVIQPMSSCLSPKSDRCGAFCRGSTSPGGKKPRQHPSLLLAVHFPQTADPPLAIASTSSYQGHIDRQLVDFLAQLSSANHRVPIPSSRRKESENRRHCHNVCYIRSQRECKPPTVKPTTNPHQ